MKFFSTALLLALPVVATAKIDEYSNFLNKEEIKHFLSVASNHYNDVEHPNQRMSTEVDIDDSLHHHLRQGLLAEENLEEELEPTSVVVTTVYSDSPPHKDSYGTVERKGEPVVGMKTGFVFLNTNDDIEFIQGSQKIHAESGKLVVFDADKEHHTRFLGERANEEDSQTDMKILGPFTITGKRFGPACFPPAC